jgi:hypothetical protein
MVVALVALFAAIGGSASALVITGRSIKDNSVGGADIRDGGVRGKEVRNRSLRGRDLATGSVTARQVRDGSLLAGDFAPGELPAGARGPQATPGLQARRARRASRAATGPLGSPSSTPSPGRPRSPTARRNRGDRHGVQPLSGGGRGLQRPGGQLRPGLQRRRSGSRRARPNLWHPTGASWPRRSARACRRNCGRDQALTYDRRDHGARGRQCHESCS